MKQVMRKTANYAADLAGINSALYELGGLIIMHDASGCNSTYATHDEPRWAKMHSLIFISALEEYDAILGNDDKLIEEVIEAANETQPNFIALFGSPIALAIGTDLKGLPTILNRKPSFLVSAFQLRAWQVMCVEAIKLTWLLRNVVCSRCQKNILELVSIYWVVRH